MGETFALNQKKRHTTLDVHVADNRTCGTRMQLFTAMLAKAVSADRGGRGVTVGWNRDPESPTRVEVWILPDADPNEPSQRLRPRQIENVRQAFLDAGFAESAEMTVEPEAPSKVDMVEHMKTLRKEEPKKGDHPAERADMTTP